LVHATVAALKMIQRPEEVAARRGLPIEDVAPPRMLKARREADALAAAAAREGNA
jgi:small subunit ribosomal protein S5